MWSVDPEIFTGWSESYLSFPGEGGDLKRILGNFINKCKFKEILPPPTLPPDLRMITRTSIL